MREIYKAVAACTQQTKVYIMNGGGDCSVFSIGGEGRGRGGGIVLQPSPRDDRFPTNHYSKDQAMTKKKTPALTTDQ